MDQDQENIYKDKLQLKIQHEERSKENHQVFINNLEMQTEGVKRSIHGFNYQLHILMLYLWRAKQSEYISFRLGTELQEAEKFDDVVFQYQQKKNYSFKLRLVQVKHSKSIKNRNISRSDLLSKNDDDYSLQKYFHSYLKIKSRCLESSMYSIFSNSEIEDLIICTNIGFDSRIVIDNFFNEIKLEKDEIWKLSPDVKEKCQKATIFMFKNIDNNEIITSLKPILKQTSDFWKLINELAGCISGEEPLNGKKKYIENKYPFDYYHYALMKNVLLIEGKAGNCENKKTKKPKIYAKFLPKFIIGDDYSNEETLFRDALIDEILKTQKIDITENILPANDIINILKNVKFNISDNFTNVFKPDPNPQIQDIKRFAHEIKLYLDKSDANSCKLIRFSCGDEKTKFIDNLCKLCGYVLITKFNKIRFSTCFLNGKELPGNLNDFRESLKELLGDEKFLSLYEYELEINTKNFRTCHEGVLYRKLPVLHTDSEVKDFFNKFKIVVNYPNGNELDNIIGEEMKVEYKTFNVDELKSRYKTKLDKWFQNSKAHLYTVESAATLFDDIKIELQIPQVFGMNKFYFDNASTKFKFNFYEYIPDFLRNSDQQILHLIFQDLELARARVIQTFQYFEINKNSEIHKYIIAYGRIFINLVQLQDDVVDCFNNSKGGNLLVIECDNEKEINLIDKLLKILKENKEKKIIFITQTDYKLPNKLTDFNYVKIVDESNFSDLTENSQKQLLENKIIFQGQNITLNELLDENSIKYKNETNLKLISSTISKYIDSKVLSELMKSNEIKIDNYKSDNLNDMKRYYIDRDFDLDLCTELNENCIKRNTSDLFVISGNIDKSSNLFPPKNDFYAEVWPKKIIRVLLMVFEIHCRKLKSKNEYITSLKATTQHFQGTIYYQYKHKKENQYKYYVLRPVLSPNNQFNYSDKFGFSFTNSYLRPPKYYKDEVKFIIVDYFQYYSELQKKQPRDGEQNIIFVIYTDGNLNQLLMQSDKIQITYEKEIDEIFDFIKDKNISKNYKFLFDQRSKIYQSVREHSEPYKLATALVKCMFHKPDFKDSKILTQYIFQLSKEIIDIPNKSFHYNFIHNVSLSEEAKNIREQILFIFQEMIADSWTRQVQIIKFEKLFQQKFLNKIKYTKDFNIFKELAEIKLNNFPNGFNVLNSIPKFFNLNELTEEFMKLLTTETKKKIISIAADNIIFGRNKANLAVHVLVKDNCFDEKVKFSSIFLDINIKLSENLECFRKLLRAGLESKGISFNELKDCIFEIEDFDTCLDNSHSLPKDLVEGFFKKIIFRVSQPDEKQIAKILNIKLDVSFNSMHQDINKIPFQEINKPLLCELYLLTFLLKKIKTKKFNKFCLVRNLLDFRDFNDIVFKYNESDGQTRYIFIKIKLLDEPKKMNFYYLFESHCFGLLNLFDSYRQIKENFQLKDGAKKFFIFTDSKFDFTNLKMHNIKIEKINNMDDLMDVMGNDIQSTKFYRLVVDKRHEICEKIMEKSTAYNKAKHFLICILTESVIEIEFNNNELERNMSLEVLLAMDVIDFKNKRLHQNFVHNKLVSKSAEIFRECFICAYRNIVADEILSEDNMWKTLQEIKLNLCTSSQALVNETIFNFIYDIILNKDISIIKQTNLFKDDETIECDIEILNNVTKLKCVKSFRISKSALEILVIRNRVMQFRLDISKQDYFTEFIMVKREELFGIIYDEDYFSDRVLTNFFTDLIFVQHFPEFESLSFLRSRRNDVMHKFLLARRPLLDNNTASEMNSFFDKSISPAMGRMLNEVDINPNKPIQIIFTSDTQPEALTQLFENYSNHTIHCIKNGNNGIIWQSSQGPLTNLRNKIIKDSKEFKSININDRIVIVAAEPGMGKSTLLKYITAKMKESYPFKWIIKIDLINCQTKLNSQDGKFDDIDEIISFLYSVVNLKTVFEEQILRFQLEKQGKIILLFDGFDEIDDSNKNKIILLLKALKKYKVEKLWITTRLHLRNIIEDELSVFSYNLRPFNDEDQTKYLEKFLMNTDDIKKKSKDLKVKETLINEYIKKLIDCFKRATSKDERDFLGIPLQTKMLAEAFQEHFSKFYTKTLQKQQTEFCFPENLNILSLYRKFIDAKYEIYFKDKKNSSNENHEVLLKQLFTELHQSIAFKILIPNFLETPEINPVNKDMLKQIGIIVESQNIELNFIHRTFAEYFVAEKLCSFLKKDSIDLNYKKTIEFLKENFFIGEMEVIIKFIDRILVEPHPIMSATLNNDEKFFKSDKFEKCVTEKPDILGRNSVHLAATYNCRNLIDFLLQITGDVNICDVIFGWSPLVYAVQNNNWYIAELLLKAGANPSDIKKVNNVNSVDKNGMTLLHFAAKFTNNEIVMDLLERDVDVNISDKNGLTPIFYAIDGGHISIIKCLINAKANVNIVNKDKLTPLAYAKIHDKLDIAKYLKKITTK